MKARVLAGLLVLLAIVLGAILEVAWGQTPQIEGLDRLTPEERAIAERNLERWQRMTPEQRARALESYRRWTSMTPEERQAARQTCQRCSQLPPEGKARLPRRRPHRKELAAARPPRRPEGT